MNVYVKKDISHIKMITILIKKSCCYLILTHNIMGNDAIYNHVFVIYNFTMI